MRKTENNCQMGFSVKFARQNSHFGAVWRNFVQKSALWSSLAQGTIGEIGTAPASLVIL